MIFITDLIRIKNARELYIWLIDEYNKSSLKDAFQFREGRLTIEIDYDNNVRVNADGRLFESIQDFEKWVRNQEAIFFENLNGNNT